ncbi:hypothetical protein ACP275_04G176000 [Erythranthe tilingii]
MASAADGGVNDAGLEALQRLKSTEPPLYLTKSEELKAAARLASKYLFASLSPYARKSPFNQLLAGEDFDAEQIWQQIDLQAHPLLSSIRRRVTDFENNPEEIKKQFNLDRASGEVTKRKVTRNEVAESPSDELDDIDDNVDEDGDEDDEEGEESEDGDDDEGENFNGVEDKFFKMKELEKYLLEDEAGEYGLEKDNKNKRKRVKTADKDDEEDEDEDEESEEEEDDQIALMAAIDGGDDAEHARYEDFFGVRKVRKRNFNQYQFRRSGKLDKHERDNNNNQVVREPDNDIDNEKDNEKDNDEDADEASDEDSGEDNLVTDEPESENDKQKKQSVSTHEKELEKKRAEIEKMEKSNMEPKTWTMQGEITAAKRPKNSALEVDLDFEHNVRPAPDITLEAHASLEELIKKRILEGQFDDVQKPATLSTKAPRERKELDETKSRKGLSELYEDEYAQKTGLVSNALTFSDEQKKEASTLFKKLCVKLDALTHFHFTPKPIIEDMSIQANVPALAMEEIAPLAVSDAAMLAPEEVFYGKGDIKEETELTKSDRKKRRAKKKRKFKAESVKTIVIKPQLTASRNPGNDKEDK